MSTIAFELQQLYQQTFGTKPVIGKVQYNTADVGGLFKVLAKTEEVVYTETGAPLTAKDIRGTEIWLPVYFFNLPADIGDNGRLFLPYCVVRISGTSTVIRTPLAERIGSAKEQYNVDDYKISLKGFFIDKENRVFPEKDLKALKKIHEMGKAFSIWNAATDIFLSNPAEGDLEQQQVIMTAFDLPEVEGGRKHVRPFTMTLESDNIFTLEVE